MEDGSGRSILPLHIWDGEYCYWRDEKYNPHKNKGGGSNIQRFADPFSQYIKVKKDAPHLLSKALKNKSVDLVSLFGYQPIEAKYRYIRGMLKVCLDLGFPVFINEKSPLLLEDLEVLKKINEKTIREYMVDLHKLVKQYCKKYGILNYIPRPVSYYPKDLQLNKEIAGKFHLKAREIQLSKDPKYRERAYRKTAWSLDELKISIAEIYEEEGLEGIMNIENVGQKIGKQIINWLQLWETDGSSDQPV